MIVTYDPRGVERSRKTDGTIEVTREQNAADVHAVIEAVGGGPVDLFASSGGAVNALALVARYPGFGTSTGKTFGATTKSAAKNGIESVKTNAPAAPTVDLTGE